MKLSLLFTPIPTVSPLVYPVTLILPSSFVPYLGGVKPRASCFLWFWTTENMVPLPANKTFLATSASFLHLLMIPPRANWVKGQNRPIPPRWFFCLCLHGLLSPLLEWGEGYGMKWFYIKLVYKRKNYAVTLHTRHCDCETLRSRKQSSGRAECFGLLRHFASLHSSQWRFVWPFRLKVRGVTLRTF